MDFVDSTSKPIHDSNTKVIVSQKVPIYNLEVAPWKISSTSPHTLDIDSDELTLSRVCPNITKLTQSEATKASILNRSLQSMTLPLFRWRLGRLRVIRKI